MEQDNGKTKYFLMSVQTILPVDSDIVEDLFSYEARNNEIEYVHRYHGTVYSIEDVLEWGKSFYNKGHGSNIEPYAVKVGEEIFFDVSEKRTIIEREVNIRKQK